MAVYTHFGGTPGLWRAVRQEGFTLLAQRLAAVELTPDPVCDLMALGAAYLANALANSAVYRTVFDAAAELENPPAGRPTGRSRSSSDASLAPGTRAGSPRPATRKRSRRSSGSRATASRCSCSPASCLAKRSTFTPLPSPSHCSWPPVTTRTPAAARYGLAGLPRAHAGPRLVGGSAYGQRARPTSCPCRQQILDR